MNLVVLRIEGSSGYVDGIHQVLGIDPTGSWRTGETSSRGGAYTTFGHTFDLADVESPVEMMEMVTGFLTHCVERSANFAASDGFAELSIAFTVGTQEQFAASVDLPVETLATLGRLGISLSINSYPTTDD
ncbi:hypothetical protein [Dyella sp. 2HG41-7]|uniref:hypothetical protein n=1 Tax=Dyella sp. 2HG41-7 TaxID=2883239 RepID=UPI001F34B61A|nr:hypothetical protein [Dyella sp. 2HG41-7]